MFKNILGALIFLIAFAAHAGQPESIEHKINNLLRTYLKKHKDSELLTGIAVSLQSPQLSKNFYVGTVSNDKNAASINGTTLFEIGSITKSFTSAIILQLEAEGILDINQTLGQWLPQYPKWKNVTIKRLLNMTSGIPDYLTNPSFLHELPKNIRKQWTKKELVDRVYKDAKSIKGFYYSNTNYILAAMIIEKATGHAFTDEINKRLLGPKHNLNNTFYSENFYDEAVMQRLAQGYYYGAKLGKIVRGQNMTDANMSIAGAAGALVSNPEDINHWVHDLVTGKVLPEKQTRELKELVSVKSGRPIKMTSAHDPSGFALGINQDYTHSAIFWDYEGDTLGYRAMYASSTCGDMIASVSLNSSPLSTTDKIKDEISKLLFNLFDLLLQGNPGYHCKNPI